jgi:hypothetical protein|nr:hypothetical protein [uncultured Acetatifactor sp.]
MNQMFTREFQTMPDLCFSLTVERNKETAVIGSKEEVWKYYCKKTECLSGENEFPMIIERPPGSFLLDFGLKCSEDGCDDFVWGQVIHDLDVLLHRCVREEPPDYNDIEMEQEAAENLDMMFCGGSAAHKYAAVFIWNEYLKAYKYLNESKKAILHGKAKIWNVMEIMENRRITKKYLKCASDEQFDMLDDLYFAHNFRGMAERLAKPLMDGNAILSLDSYPLIKNPTHFDDAEFMTYRPFKRREKGYVQVIYSFTPLMKYYFDKLDEWKLKFQPECIVCHKPFLPKSLREKTCSEECKKRRNSESGAEYRERESERDYSRLEHNLRQYIYRLQKKTGLSPAVKTKLDITVKQIFQEMKQNKEMVKRGEMPEREFITWIEKQHMTLDDIVYPKS